MLGFSFLPKRETGARRIGREAAGSRAGISGRSPRASRTRTERYANRQIALNSRSNGLQSAEYRANIVDDIVLGDHDGLIARIEHHVVGRHFSLAVFAAVNGNE